MNINISQNRPLIHQLKRIADALERIASPPTISDPATEHDVSFTDEFSDYIEEEREKRARLRTQMDSTEELERDVLTESD